MIKPRRRLAAARVIEEDSVAILVHGTYAGASEDVGTKWWQSGSGVVQQLKTRFPSSIDVAPVSKVFHWSGENSERARNKAAVELLQLMKLQEAQGKAYHLIGHSHGGSVIWNALKLATLHRNSLTRLRTWTTVGTPFLQHRSRSAWNPLNILGIVVGLFLLRPAYRAFKQVSIILWSAATGAREGLLLPLEGGTPGTTVLGSPILTFIKWTGVKVTETKEGIQVGSFDPNGNESLAAYLFASGEGIFLLTTAILAAYLFLNIGLICIRPAIESYRIRAEQRLEDLAFARFQARWLGIWSTDDEAINGLRATLDLAMSFVSKMEPRERVFLTDTFNLISSPIFWIFAPAYNVFVYPTFDRTVRSIVARSAQGNDRPTANIIDVTPSPVGQFRELAPSIPAELNEKILKCADEAARDIAPKLRRLLGQPSFTSGLAAFGKELSGNELVHTSYFDHPEVLDLIACNIAWGTSDDSLHASLVRCPASLAKWFVLAKSQLVSATHPPGSLPDIHVPKNAAA